MYQPSLWSSYWRALKPKSSHSEAAQHFAPLTLDAVRVSSDTARLKAYRQLLALPDSSSLPLCWPNIMSFPLQLAALTAPQLSLPVMGLLHVRNRICQYQAIPAAAALDFVVTLLPAKSDVKGLVITLKTQAYWQGQLSWEQEAEHLYRLPAILPPKPLAATSTDNPDAFAEKPAHLVSALFNSSLSRRYARLSGDINPIHLSQLSARWFGLRGAIAHGMHLKASALAQLALPSAAYQVSVHFRKALFLPGEVQLHQRSITKQNQQFMLFRAESGQLLLDGNILAI